MILRQVGNLRAGDIVRMQEGNYLIIDCDPTPVSGKVVMTYIFFMKRPNAWNYYQTRREDYQNLEFHTTDMVEWRINIKD